VQIPRVTVAGSICSDPRPIRSTDATWINRTQAGFAALNADVHPVWVYCDVETMHTYVRRRGAARDASKLADWAGYAASIDVDFRPAAPYALIDNRASSEPLQAQAKELLRKVLGGEGA
jgi:hypothetical protein